MELITAKQARDIVAKTEVRQRSALIQDMNAEIKSKSQVGLRSAFIATEHEAELAWLKDELKLAGYDVTENGEVKW